MRFEDRAEAGRRLAQGLEQYRGQDPIVLGIPSGGAVIGAEVARRLDAPLELFFVQRLRAPGHPELSVGAIAESTEVERVLDLDSAHVPGVSEKFLEREEKRRLDDIRKRRRQCRSKLDPASLTGRTVILVDDGVTTGATVRAAVQALRRVKPGWLVLALPVAPSERIDPLFSLVDHLVCLVMPNAPVDLNTYYEDFEKVSDDTVRTLLEEVG